MYYHHQRKGILRAQTFNFLRSKLFHYLSLRKLNALGFRLIFSCLKNYVSDLRH